LPARAYADVVIICDNRHPCAAQWLVGAANTINALYWLTSAIQPDDLRFSIVEALYARGFTSVASIAALSSDDFHDALVGTYFQALQGQTFDVSFVRR